jgi:hypothetical protein
LPDMGGQISKDSLGLRFGSIGGRYSMTSKSGNENVLSKNGSVGA